LLMVVSRSVCQRLDLMTRVQLPSGSEEARE
jgi:hypothetical protein